MKIKSITSSITHLKTSLQQVYKNSFYILLTEFIAVVVILANYLILRKTTTLNLFWESNITLYNWLQIAFTIVIAALIGISVTMFIYILKMKKKGGKSSLFSLIGTLIYSSAATGCTVCGVFLLPLLGVAASLTALPFAGLEIKFLSILILLYGIVEYARIIVGECKVPSEKIVTIRDRMVEFNINKNTLPQLKHVAILLVFITIIYALPYMPKSWRFKMQKSLSTNATVAPSTSSTQSTDTIFIQINPPQGYEINVRFEDIGPKMIEMGVIDLEKFKSIYKQSGQPLTDEQLQILTKGSNKKITITPENSYFLLNFFWAFGLANKTKILTEGDMVKYGEGQTGSFASTGGWSLAKSDPMEYYAQRAIVSLTAKQEDLVNRVASNVYRPCCANPTSFPDCNHGMALLGIFELMAAQGAKESEMYQAAKYINSYWFPSNAYDVALYFKNAEGKDFKDIDPKVFLSKDYFSAFGAQKVKSYLVDKGIQQKPPTQGGGCGV